MSAASAFAQQIDQTWAAQGDGSETQFSLTLIQASSATAWTGRSPLEASVAGLPESYAGIAEGIVAAIVAADAQIVSSGIDPNQTGGNTTSSGFEIGPSTPLHTTLVQLEPDQILLRVGVLVLLPFDGLARLRLSTASNILLGVNDVPLNTVGQYANLEEIQIETPDALSLDFTPGGATVGHAYVTFLVGR